MIVVNCISIQRSRRNNDLITYSVYFTLQNRTHTYNTEVVYSIFSDTDNGTWKRKEIKAVTFKSGNEELLLWSSTVSSGLAISHALPLSSHESGSSV